MKKRFILNLCICLALLLSLTPYLTLAQELYPSEDAESNPGEGSTTLSGLVTGERALAVSLVFSGGPAYDSGWVVIAQDEAKTLSHNLGGSTDDYVVDMQYWTSGADGVNQRYYGGTDFGANPPAGHAADDRVGVYWRSLTATVITVYRRPQDTYAEKVRIRIWVDASDNWDSGWVSLPFETATTLNHNLGGTSDDYIVDMQYRGSGQGVNQRHFAGTDYGANPPTGHSANDRVGVYWRSLSNTNIVLYRRAEDNYADEVRIRIWLRPTPTYDSGWLPLNLDQAQTIAHNIGGSADDYVVDMQFRSPGNGVNQRHYGGMDFGANPPGGMAENDRVGAYWRTLTNSSITIYRRPEDIYAPEIRIRIWNAWKPALPDYDSDWVAVGLDQSETLTHNLGGNTGNYYVDMQYRASGVDGINQRYFGGMDFGSNPTSGHAADDRVGAYWRSLNNASITAYRRPEDTYAAEIRLRIWIMPTPDYDSDWVALAQDTSQAFIHNLKGNPQDYLVDLQYRSGGSAINQRYYGGMDLGANPSAELSENDRMGAYWRSLDNTSITVYRRPEDIYAEDVRVRIWRMAAPDYNSGWTLMTPDVAQTFTHNLGGIEQAYLLVVYQYDESSANYINQRHLGGADFGALPPTGYNSDDRVGSYWRTLTNTSLIVYRRPEDGFADRVMIRIWDYTQKLYLPLLNK